MRSDDTIIRVLLVDDEPDFTSVLSKRLSRTGMEVATASDACEAYGTLDRCPFDVAVVDINMPGIDGIQTLKAVKRSFREVEVIILTGHGTIHEAGQALHSGAFDFLFKPVSFEQLASRIRDAAGREPDRKRIPA
ncbi:response regulator [Pseudodesulfovibrio sp. zrk46]|uniref:response regulator n=1 Tax=Pseudodesulfovibrio sp. zrk46 TaxID=2725288 RepID=UPI001449CE30|nr:response regulator [Pseudodesulfovibrio sp. zrk46]QJB57448.1 response regulator [Pseudodesulfovibrio sp. zrk46]